MAEIDEQAGISCSVRRLMKLFKELLADKNYLIFWIGQLLSMVGNWMIIVTLPVWIYKLTDSASQLGIVMSIAAVGMLLSPFTGLYVDLLDRKKVMNYSVIAQSLLLLPLLTVNSGEQLIIVYSVVFLWSIFSRVLIEARNAALPDLVGNSRIISANALMQMTDTAAQIISPILLTIIIKFFSLSLMIIFGSLCFILTSVFISLTVFPVQGGIERTKSISAAFYYSETVEGFRVMWESDLLRRIIFLWGIGMIGGASINFLMVVFIERVLKLPPEYYGYLISLLSIGMISGAFSMGRLGNKFQPQKVVSFGLMSIFLSLAVFANIHMLPVTILSIFVLGMSLSIVNITDTTILQNEVESRFRGRVLGIATGVLSISSLISFGVGGILSDYIGVQRVMNICVFILFTTSVLAFFLIYPVESGEKT